MGVDFRIIQIINRTTGSGIRNTQPLLCSIFVIIGVPANNQINPNNPTPINNLLQTFSEKSPYNININNMNANIQPNTNNISSCPFLFILSKPQNREGLTSYKFVGSYNNLFESGLKNI